MLLNYWHYGITKNWGYVYHDKMIDTNTFCYGKTKSRKTDNVGHTYLSTAINKGRSVVLYAPQNNIEYEDMIDLASESGYLVLRINVNKPITDSQSLIIDRLPWEQTMICLENDNFNETAQYNNADKILSRICEITRSAELEEIVQIILDGLCGNMLVQSAWLQNDKIKFCIIMGDMIASARWRKSASEALCERLMDAGGASLKTAINSFKYDCENDLDYALQRFFKPIETIICTGVNNVKPQDQKEFVSHCFFARDNIKGMGGRFCIEEHPEQERLERAKSLSNNQNAKPIKIEEDIENTDYKLIAEKFIKENRWIVEINGRVQVLNAGGTQIPISFLDQFSAKKWVEMCLKKGELPVLDCVEGQDVVIYSIPATIENPLSDDNLIPLGAFAFNASTYFNLKHFVQNPNVTFEQIENGELESEIAITRVKTSDVRNIQMNFLISVLEIAEAESAVRELCNDFIDRFGDQEEIDNREAFDFFQSWKTPAEREIEKEETEGKSYEIPEEYRWKPYVKAESLNASTDNISFDPISILPKDGVLFLGGHQNMTKKLRQIFPDWEYISDDLFKRGRLGDVKTIFFWTAHSSHSMMEFINARKAEGTTYVYVTATNINRLISEMAEKYLGTEMTRKEIENE